MGPAAACPTYLEAHLGVAAHMVAAAWQDRATRQAELNGTGRGPGDAEASSQVACSQVAPAPASVAWEQKGLVAAAADAPYNIDRQGLLAGRQGHQDPAIRLVVVLECHQTGRANPVVVQCHLAQHQPDAAALVYCGCGCLFSLFVCLLPHRRRPGDVFLCLLYLW